MVCPFMSNPSANPVNVINVEPPGKAAGEIAITSALATVPASAIIMADESIVSRRVRGNFIVSLKKDVQGNGVLCGKTYAPDRPWSFCKKTLRPEGKRKRSDRQTGGRSAR